MNVVRSLHETSIEDGSGQSQIIKQGRVYNVKCVKAFHDHLEITFFKDDRIWTGNPIHWEMYAMDVL